MSLSTTRNEKMSLEVRVQQLSEEIAFLHRTIDKPDTAILIDENHAMSVENKKSREERLLLSQTVEDVQTRQKVISLLSSIFSLSSFLPPSFFIHCFVMIEERNM